MNIIYTTIKIVDNNKLYFKLELIKNIYMLLTKNYN